MPIRRIEGATPAPVIEVNGKYVTLWNHGTIADGVKLTVNTLGPICSAINDGYGDLSAALDAEKERAIQAETELSGWCDSISSKLDTVSSNLDIVSGDLDDEILRSTNKDDDLQDQIDTLKAATDVIMVYSAYSDFSSNSGSLTLTDNDVIKVLNDEERQENQTYYQYSTDTSAWSFIGKLDPYYSKNDLENAAGKNINITTANDLKINTNDNVNFDSVSASTAYGSSAKFTNISATNTTATEAKVLTLTSNTLYGQSNNSNVDTLIGSAQSGAEASAYITAHSADFLNSAHNVYGKLTFGTKEYPATNYNSNFTFLAGQGIGFTTGNNQVTISAEGTTYQASSYISTANKKISVTGSLITSAEAGSAASAWINNNTLFDYSYTDSIETETASGSIEKIKILYKNDVTDHDVMHNQEMVFSRGNYSVSGLLIQAANSNDNGKVLTYNSTANNYTWQPIPDSTYTNGDDNITIDNVNRTIGLATSGIKTSSYSATYIGTSGQYDSILNGQTLRFSHGQNSINIALTGVSYYAGGTNNGSAKWDNLFQNYAQVNRERINTTSNLTADKVNFIVATGSSGTQPYKAVNFKITASVPPILDDDVYYII